MPELSRAPVRILAGARLVSVTGSMATEIALSVVIWSKTHSAAWLSIYFLFSFGVTGFLSPFTGTIGDRFNRRVVMVVSELLGAGLCLALIFTTSPGMIVFLAFLASVVHQPLHATTAAAIPKLAGEDRLEWGNSLISMSQSVGMMAGPAIGGALTGFIGIRAVLLADIVSFLVSAVLIGFTPGDFGGKSHSEEHKGVLAGYRHVLRDPTLRALAIAWAVVAFALDAALVADLPLVEELGKGSFAFGMLMTAWAGGAIVGALAARRLNERTEPGAIVLGVAAVALGYALIALSPLYAMVFVIMAATAVADSAGGVAGNSFIQRRTPDEVRARVFAAVSSMWLMANVIAFPLAGLVLGLFGPRAVYVMGALVAVASTIMLLPILKASRRAQRESST